MIEWQIIGIGLGLLSAVLCLCLLYTSFRGRQIRIKADNAIKLINNLSEGVYRSTLDGRQLSANRALVKLNGYSSEREMLKSVANIEKEWYVDPSRRAEFKQILTRDGFVEDFVSEIKRHKTGERIWITENARLVIDNKSGAPLYYEGTVRDISDSVRKRSAEVRLNKLADIAPGGLFQLRRETDGTYTIPFLSRPFKAMTGVEHSENNDQDKQLLAGVDDRDFPEYLKSLNDSYAKLQPWRCVFRFRKGLNEPVRWLEINALPEQTIDGAIEWYGFMNDISEHKELVQRIERLAYFDPLTDLPNRRLLMNRLEQAMKISSRRRDHGGLLFIDLDGFKAINDTYGHDAGDVYITKIARRIEESLRESDTVARLGGDEFVILVHDLGVDYEKAKNDSIVVANKVLTNLRRGVELNGVIQSVGCSMGINLFCGTNDDAEDIIKNADKAMYMAKAAGRNRYIFFEAEQDVNQNVQKGAA